MSLKVPLRRKLVAPGIFVLLLLSGPSFIQCTKDTDIPVIAKEDLGDTAHFTAIEKETWRSVNEYRKSIGLKKLKAVHFISEECRRHSTELGEGKAKPHDGFNSRVDSIKLRMQVHAAGENIYEAEGVSEEEIADHALQGWLKSPSHKEVVEGNYTHAGAGVFKTADGGYFLTMIFVRE